MTYIEKDTYRNGIKIQYFISQKKSSDGIVTRVEEQLTQNGKRQKKEELTSTDVIHRTYYTPEGNYRLLIHNNRCVGMLIVGEKYLIPFSLAYREISGKEIEYNNTLCWEITETAKSSRGMLKYIITVEKNTFLLLKVSKITEDGKLYKITEYSDFNFSPVIEEDDFIIPSDAKISKASNFREAALLWEEIILKDAHETINVVGKEIKPKTSRWTSFWRKVKRNPSPYIIGVALVLAGISFGTAALLKRREKKQ